MSQVKRVLLVGHCGPDTWALRSWVERVLNGVTVAQLNNDTALENVNGDSLLLINRVLDGQFSNDNGIELIRRLGARPTRPRMMLVSNFPDAQQQAEQAGALPGFGKSELGSPQATHRLQQAAAPVGSEV